MLLEEFEKNVFGKIKHSMCVPQYIVVDLYYFYNEFYMREKMELSKEDIYEIAIPSAKMMVRKYKAEADKIFSLDPQDAGIQMMAKFGAEPHRSLGIRHTAFYNGITFIFNYQGQGVEFVMIFEGAQKSYFYSNEDIRQMYIHRILK